MNELVTTQRPGSVAVALFLSTKVQSQHLEKLALVYVRQSRSHPSVLTMLPNVALSSTRELLDTY